mgnify:CR=1 FL=1
MFYNSLGEIIKVITVEKSIDIPNGYSAQTITATIPEGYKVASFCFWGKMGYANIGYMNEYFTMNNAFGCLINNVRGQNVSDTLVLSITLIKE